MPDVGLRQRRGVVDAVAGHRDDPALGLQPPHHVAVSGPAAPRRSPRRCPAGARPRAAVICVVAGQHDDPQPVGVQQPDRFGGRGLDRIGDGEQAGGRAVDARRTSPSGPRCRSASAVACERRPRRCRDRSSERGVADERRVAVHDAPRRPCPVDDWKLGRRRQCRARARARRRRSPPPAGARWPVRAPRRGAAAVGFVERRQRPRTSTAAACPRSACRSCRRRACRPARAARAPRRS